MAKEFKIELHNFQSLTEAKLSLPLGLTIVTGASNNGKTAIIRAIEACVFNTGSDEYIKVGSTGFSVRLSNKDHTVLFKRSLKGRTDKTTYEFDGGEAQKKVGRTQLPEMERFFNISEVKLQNNQRARLNFWYQNDKPFLMDKTAGQLYEFLSVSSADKYLNVLRQMKNDSKTAASEEKILMATIDTVKKEKNIKEEFLEQNKDFPLLFDRLTKTKEQKEKTEDRFSTIRFLSDLTRVLTQKQAAVSEVDRKLSRFDIKQLENALSDLAKASLIVSERSGQTHSLKDISERLQGKIEALEKVSAKSSFFSEGTVFLRQKLEDFSVRQDKLSVVGQKITEADFLSKLIYKKQEELQQKTITVPDGRVAEIQNQLSNMEAGDRWLQEQLVRIRVLHEARQHLDKMTHFLSAKDKDYLANSREFEELAATIGYCPFCGSNLDGLLSELTEQC